MSQECGIQALMIAGPQSSVAALNAGHEKSIAAFVSYCEHNGLKLTWDGKSDGRCRIIAPPIQGFEVWVSFCAFVPGTSESKMRDALMPFAAPFVYYNEEAALAMSEIELRGAPGIPMDASKRASSARATLIELFHRYRPSAPVGGTTRPATTQPSDSKQKI